MAIFSYLLQQKLAPIFQIKQPLFWKKRHKFRRVPTEEPAAPVNEEKGVEQEGATPSDPSPDVVVVENQGEEKNAPVSSAAAPAEEEENPEKNPDPQLDNFSKKL